MPKGTSPDEAVQKSSPYLYWAIIELHLSEGVSQSVSQSDSQPVENSFFKNSIATVLKRFRPTFKAIDPSFR